MPKAQVGDTHVYTHPSGARVIAVFTSRSPVPYHLHLGGLTYFFDESATSELRKKILESS